jgi:hypothetical protein
VDENLVIAKDGFDNGVIFIGPFTPKKVILAMAAKEFSRKKVPILKII